MNESFKKIKEKLLIRAILISVATGVSCGLLAAGIVLLALKLNGIAINAGYYVLIAVLTAAAIGVPLFFLLRPDDRKTAKALDKEYSLNERVQTMVEFRNAESEMAQLQRENTEEALKTLPKRKIGFKFGSGAFFGGLVWNNIVQYCVAPVVALAVFLPAIIIPMRSVPADGDDNDDYSASKFELTALNQLIGEVKKSSLESDLKLTFTQSLEKLLGDVSETQSKSFMETCVSNTVITVDNAVTAANSYAAICAQLSKYEKSKPVSSAIVNGVTAYKSSGLSIDSYDKVEQVEAQLNNLVTVRMESKISPLRDEFAVTIEEGLGGVIAGYVEAIQTALTASDSDGEDALYLSLNGFSDSLGVLSGYVAAGEYQESFLQSRVESAFNALIRESAAATTTQSYNRMMDEYVRIRLWNIFGISISLPSMGDEELIRREQGGSAGGNGEEGDNNNNNDKNENGGYGSGGAAFGSDDKIYDPATNGIVDYGEALQEEYYAKMKDQLDSGDYPEELKQAIKEYFDLLLGKAEQNQGEN